VIRGLLFLLRLAWWRRQPVPPADVLAERARAAAGRGSPKTSLRRLAKLWWRVDVSVDRQVDRKLSVDPQVLALCDAMLSECLRRRRLYSLDEDANRLEQTLREFRRLRYKRKDAERFAAELQELTPAGSPPVVRKRPPRPRRLPWRPRRENPDRLARKAAAAERGDDAGLRSIRLLRVAVRAHVAVKRQQARRETVDERLLVVTHGVIVEAARRGRAFGLSADDLDERLAEILLLPYDHEEAERYAAELGRIGT